MAGRFASGIFAAGIIGVGLIGVPILAGSGAYALCEAMDWPWGLERKANEARGFYAVIAISTLLALVIQYLPINPMRALVYSAIINGVAAVPLMAVITIIASRPALMGAYTASKPIVFLGWLGTAIMAAASILMLI